MRGRFSVVERPELVLGLLTLALHLWVNGSYGYFRDELYYIACGRHPAFGYTDQPPLIPLIAWASDVAFHSLRGLRLVPAIACAATVALTAHAAGMLGGGLYARWLAGLAVLGGGVLQWFGVTLSTDCLEPLAWLAIGLCVVKAQDGDDRRWWIAAGAIAGVAFLAKYTAALYVVSIAVGLLATSERRLLLRWEPWVGALLALAVAAPSLAWQAANGWPFVVHTAVLAAERNIPYSPVAFLPEEVGFMGPATAPIWIAGLAAFALRPSFARWRWIAVSWLVLVAASVIGRGRPYYIAPAYPLLMAGGATALEAWLPRLTKPVFAGLVFAVAGLMTPMFLPILPVGAFIAYEQAIHFRPHTGEKFSALGDLPQYYADQFGWPEMAEVVGKAYQALPPEDRKRAAFFAQNYGDAAAIDFFGTPYGLPPAISPHENYFLWGPHGTDGSVVLILGGKREDHLKNCRSVEPVSRFDHPLAMPYERDQTLWLCRDIAEPFEQLWPRLRHFG